MHTFDPNFWLAVVGVGPVIALTQLVAITRHDDAFLDAVHRRTDEVREALRRSRELIRRAESDDPEAKRQAVSETPGVRADLKKARKVWRSDMVFPAVLTVFASVTWLLSIVAMFDGLDSLQHGRDTTSRATGMWLVASAVLLLFLGFLVERVERLVRAVRDVTRKLHEDETPP